jgi:spermidine synthase
MGVDWSGRLVLIFALFFASGLTGLIYQVVWSRLLTLVVGVSIFAVTAVICTYMAGLALGSYVIGRVGERLGDPLRVYGVLEGVIGIYAALTPWIFGAINPVYIWAFQSFEGDALNAVRITLSALVLLAPTALMGGTLPLLARAVTGGGDGAARWVGRLYAINTFGAVMGCLAAGFVLLGEVGIRGSLFITAVLNLSIGAAAFLAPRASASAALQEARAIAPAVDGRFLLAVFFVSGLAALGYEVLWTRALLVYLKASTYAFSLMLAVYLVGIAVGSLLASGIAATARQPLAGVAICQLGVAASAALGLLVFQDLDGISLAVLGTTGIGSFGQAVSLMFVQAALVLLLPTLFMGAMFPFGIAAYHDSSRGVSHTVGSLYAVNTAGNIAGSIFIGFFAISMFGVRDSMLGMIGLNLAVAAALAARATASAGLRALAALGAAAALWIIQLGVPPQIFLNSFWNAPGVEIIFYKEGASDTVAVFEKRDRESQQPQSRVLIYSDGRGAAGTSSLQWNLYFGHLPMLLHRDPQRVLHICYGSGNSVMALTRHDPERIDVVELSPHVRDASHFFWTNEGVIDDPRVNLMIEDGRNYLMATDRSYDVISLEPPSIYTAGVVNLYTQEFYELALRHLNPGGIFVQWLPTGQLGVSDRGSLIRSITEAFPNVYTFQQLAGPTLLVMGTLEPLRVDLDELQRRLVADAMSGDAARMGTTSAVDFLSWFLMGTESTRRYAEAFEPVRDDRTIVDYSIPRFAGSGFGFAAYTYRIDSEQGSPQLAMIERSREYANLGDPASLIVPDPDQAQQLDAAIADRKRRSKGLVASRARQVRGRAER